MAFGPKEEVVSRVVLLLFPDHFFEVGAILGGVFGQFIYALLQICVCWGQNQGRRRVPWIEEGLRRENVGGDGGRRRRKRRRRRNVLLVWEVAVVVELLMIRRRELH